jgi:hypothetical protein
LPVRCLAIAVSFCFDIFPQPIEVTGSQFCLDRFGVLLGGKCIGVIIKEA